MAAYLAETTVEHWVVILAALLAPQMVVQKVAVLVVRKASLWAALKAVNSAKKMAGSLAEGSAVYLAGSTAAHLVSHSVDRKVGRMAEY